MSNPRRVDLPITVRAPDGVDLKVPRWMMDPAAEALQCSEQVALSLAAIRAVIELVAARDSSKVAVADAVVPVASGSQAKNEGVPAKARRVANATDTGASLRHRAERSRSGDAPRPALRDVERAPRGRSRGAAR